MVPAAAPETLHGKKRTMRQATFTDSDAAAIIGPRGSFKITKENRPHVRRWLNAQGFPAAFTAGLSYIELRLAYNDTTGREIEKLRKKLGDDATENAPESTGQATLPVDFAEAAKANGHFAIDPDQVDPDAASLAQALTALANKGKTVDVAQVRTIVAESLQKGIADISANLEARVAEAAKIVRIEVKLPDADTFKEVEGHHHAMFPTLLKAATARQPDGFHPNIWISGPTGSGKTHGVKLLAKALERSFVFNGALSQSFELTGFRDGHGTYHTTPFRDAYASASVYCFDEVDASDNSALLALNAALANGVAYFPDGRVERHKDSLIVATANTWGLSGTAEYVGRAKIDAAFLSRFAVKIFWDYDEDLERQICGNADWAKHVQAARAKARAAGLKVVICPRVSIAGAALVNNGFTFEEASNITYLANCTTEQRRMIAA